MIASVVVLAIVVVVAVASFAVGHSGKAALRENLAQDRTKLNSTQGRLGALQSKYTGLQSKYATSRQQLSTAQAVARQATATAEAAAKTQYADKMFTVDQEQKQLTGQEKQLKTELGQVQASSISGSGVYVVGQDIKSGVWHTNGDGGMTDDECYYATLSSTDTEDILDNNNFNGDETVNVSGAYALEISGPCTWVLAG